MIFHRQLAYPHATCELSKSCPKIHFSQKNSKIEHILQKFSKFFWKNYLKILIFPFLRSDHINQEKFPMNSIILFRNVSKNSKMAEFGRIFGNGKENS